MKEIINLEREVASGAPDLPGGLLIKAKQFGFSDRQIAALTGKTEQEIYELRKSLMISPDFKLVDTCAAEFEARTPYYYSTYDK